MQVLVLGGGAAGLMAAITAIRQGHAVTLLERQARVGRKLLATGNGRCNLTNLHLEPTHYHGASPEFVRPALARFGLAETLDFFRSIGLLTVSEPGGRVLSPLRSGRQCGGCAASDGGGGGGAHPHRGGGHGAIAHSRGFQAACPEETFPAQRVILCCGGMAGIKLGGTRSGYTLLESLGHRTTRLFPALVPIKDRPHLCPIAEGRPGGGGRIPAAGTASLSGPPAGGRFGFTEYGVSGPVIFELSRHAATEKGALTLHLNLLHRLTAEAGGIATAFAGGHHAGSDAGEPVSPACSTTGWGARCCAMSGYGLGDPVSILRDRDLRRVAAAMQDFVLPVTGVLGAEGAQVTAGGTRTGGL